MKKLSLVVLVLTIAAAIPFAATLQGAQAGAPAADAKKGEVLYQKYGCWQCHGYTGQTGNATILVNSPLSAAGFTNYLRNPRTPGMPLYSAKIVPDTEAADIFAYIKTFKKPAEAKDIPLLQQIINEK